MAWIILSIWGVFALLPIIYFASIALRPRNEIIAPVPIYFPTLTTETWLKIWTEWPIGLYFYNSIPSYPWKCSFLNFGMSSTKPERWTILWQLEQSTAKSLIGFMATLLPLSEARGLR